MSRQCSFVAFAALLAVSITPAISSAQGSPLAQAFRDNAKESGKNLVAAAEVMPEAKYVYKPTPAQMSYGEIVVHLIQGNELLCGAVGGSKAPARSKVAATDNKAALVARLRETFQFCDQALAGLDDSKLTEQLPMFGKTMSRAAVELVTVGDWADHYSQMANYLRLNNLLPPTAKK